MDQKNYPPAITYFFWRASVAFDSLFLYPLPDLRTLEIRLERFKVYDTCF